MELDSEQLLPQLKTKQTKGDYVGVGGGSDGSLSGLSSILNLGSAVFNLMNAVIGAGIISLGYAASVLGSVQFVVWLLIVVIISAFTMDLVCALSKYAGCYQDLMAESEDANGNSKIEVCNRNEECNHRRLYSYEKIGELLFNGWIKLAVNIIILFYLLIAITTYFIIIKENLPGIVIGVAQMLGYTHLVDTWWADGRFLLGMMILFVQLPLGLLRRIDFLGFTSFIGMGCMMSFVGLVVQKQPDAAALCGNITYEPPLPEPVCYTENFKLSINSAYAIPMMLFSFMCHGNILSIVAEIKPSVDCKSAHPSPKRLRKMILGSTVPTTILYIITALFAYSSYFNRTASFLLKLYGLWLDGGDIMLIVSKILVTLCITFSVPILHYPCRYSLWNLFNSLFPSLVPPAFDNGYPETWNRKWYYLFAVFIQGGLYALVCITNDFKLVLSLGGAIAGSCIIQVFPAMFYLKIHRWRYDSFYDKIVWFIGALGVVTFFANTGLIIIQNVADMSNGSSKNFFDEQNKNMFETMGRAINQTISANITA